jgi:hypothetical protein
MMRSAAMTTWTYGITLEIVPMQDSLAELANDCKQRYKICGSSLKTPAPSNHVLFDACYHDDRDRCRDMFLSDRNIFGVLVP